MAKRYMKKTLYWDIETEAKLKKIKRRFKKDGRVSQSTIVRKAIHMTPFDKMVEELNNDLKGA